MDSEKTNLGVIDINKRRKEEEERKQKNIKPRDTYYCPWKCNLF